MKKLTIYILMIILIMCSLAGCGFTEEKSTNLSIIYVITVLLSMVLLVGYFFVAQKKDKWFILLFASVLIVNIGYLLLAVSASLQGALMANRVAYFGSVFLPFAMLMIIMDSTNVKSSRCLIGGLLIVSILVFGIAASQGILDIYYKEVSFEMVNGVGTLIKIYGPLHFLYLLYLLCYFGSMIGIIVQSSIAKKVDTVTHAVLMAIAVFINIGVWLLGQFISVPFEMLSISYIFSEVFLLGVNYVMNENKKLTEKVKTIENEQKILISNESEKKHGNESQKENNIEDKFEILEEKCSNIEKYSNIEEKTVMVLDIDTEQVEMYISGVELLTKTEKIIYEAYVSRMTTKEVMAKLNITENTLKYHNKNIYSKLGVSSRKELLEIYKKIQTNKN